MDREKLREKQHLKMLKYRRENREKIRAYDRKRYKEKNRNKTRHNRIFSGKFCKICEIRLDGNYGAKGTKIHCRACADDKKKLHRLYMRQYRYIKKYNKNYDSNIQIAKDREKWKAIQLVQGTYFEGGYH